MKSINRWREFSPVLENKETRFLSSATRQYKFIWTLRYDNNSEAYLWWDSFNMSIILQIGGALLVSPSS